MAWRDLIRHNFWWKITALALASLIWLTVRFGEQGFGLGSLMGREIEGRKPPESKVDNSH